MGSEFQSLFHSSVPQGMVCHDESSFPLLGNRIQRHTGDNQSTMHQTRLDCTFLLDNQVGISHCLNLDNIGRLGKELVEWTTPSTNRQAGMRHKR